MTLRSLSDIISDLRQALAHENPRIETLLEGVHERGFGLVLLMFCIPLALPFPKPPGISTIFGLPLLLLTLQQAAGRHTVWMPGFILRRAVPGDRLDHMLERSLPFIERLEFFIRPRLEFVTKGLFSNLIGVAGVLISICIMIPLPLTNTVTSIGLGLMALGVTMRDGLCVLAGMCLGLGWTVIILGAYAFFGMEGLNAIRSFF